MTTKVFVVEHLHVFEDGSESVKLIGVYSTEDKAAQAIGRLCSQPGFCDAPDGFTTDTYLLDQDNWETGYITV